MKKENLTKLLLLFVASLFCINYLFAAEVLDDVRMLKSFYTKYITNILENKDKANNALMGEYFLPVLIGEVQEMNEHSGADNVIRAQDASKEMLNTLAVSSLGNGWYMVSYKTVWRNTEIPVKVTHHNGKRLIEYIMPDTIGNKYGDKYINKNVNADDIAEGIKMLKSFYSQYISNQLENNDKANVPLRSEYVAPELLERIPALNERSGFDLILNAQDVKKEMLNSLKVTSLEKPDWYMVTYSWDGKDETAIVVKLERVGNKLMIRYIVPIKKVPKNGTASMPQKREDGAYFIVDEKAEFPGGTIAMQSFIGEHFKRPANCTQGFALVNFVIDTDGTIRDAKIVRSAGKEVDNEALRVVGLMPKWKPAKVKGKVVPMVYNIPFRVQ